MAKELLITQAFDELRVVLTENGEIIDFLMERGSERKAGKPCVGNIYKGKVVRVLPGMQSAFVDIGYEKAAFLYVDDAYVPSLQEQRDMAERAKKAQAEEALNKVGEMIPDELSTLSESVNMKFRPAISIENFLKEGQEIIVQVAKEPISTKGPRVTCHITLAGRYIVYMPFIEHTGVSRRIENDAERDRLKGILDAVKLEGRGAIARTVAEGQSQKTLKTDYNMLVKIWKEVDKIAKSSKPARCIHHDLSFVQRVLRDFTDEDVSRVCVDSKEVLKEAEKFGQKFIPSLKGCFELYTDDMPLFERHNIEIEIERALSNHVYLRSGGSINVDQTEALVSIDVNTGKFVGRKTLEETIVKTNLEAVKEITYQLRLRNCGGIIIIDFIDMEKEENRNLVYRTLLDALKKDRAKTNVLPISALGLVEMTRKRTRDTLTRVMSQTCPYCEGVGHIKSTVSVCYDLIREVMKELKKTDAKRIQIFAHPEVTARLAGENLDMIEMMEDQYGKTLIIRSENNYHPEQYEIFPQES